MTGNVYVGPAGPVEEHNALTLYVDWPEGVESIRTINDHGVVDVARGGMIAAVVTSPNGRVRAGTLVVLVPVSYCYAATMGGSGFGRFASPGNGLVSVPVGAEAQAAVEVRLREAPSIALIEPPP